MTASKRREYTDQFKSEAVGLLVQTGKSVNEIAQDLGINPNLLYRWRNEEQQAKNQGKTRAAVRIEQEELVRLRRELDTVRKERDFLKRAAAFFAREHK